MAGGGFIGGKLPRRKATSTNPAVAARPPPAPARKRGVGFGLGIRSWLAVDGAGAAEEVEVGKHSIMRRTGLPARDLRILDPVLAYPSTLLGRDRAIVVNLEHIKAVVTATEVLVLNPRDPLVAPFVDALRRRLLVLDRRRRRSSSSVDPHDGSSHGGHGRDQEEGGALLVSRFLPFEFVALEACLEIACGCLENEAEILEREAHPALDKLTSKISTLNLERVRQIKSRLLAITGRVQKVRDELENLLDEDDDMAEMYLTDKLVTMLNLSDGSSSSSPPSSSVNGNEEDDAGDARPPDHEIPAEEDVGNQFCLTRNCSTRSACKRAVNVQELEMLLEAYFVQVEGTLNKLSALREYVDDTEDFINIMLDDKQNHLLQTGVVLATATLVLSAYVVLTGIFGMNIDNSLFHQEALVDRGAMSPSSFGLVVGGGAVGSVFVYAAIIGWCKHKGLLE